MRYLAIDLGTRRVGFALSDEGGRFATPLEVAEVRSPADAADRAAALAAREGPGELVVGLPLNMDDSVGPAAKATAAWATALGKRLDLRVNLVDERLSSFAAEQSLNERRRGGERLTRGGKKKRLDALAAAGFLQAFLDGSLRAIDIDESPE